MIGCGGAAPISCRCPELWLYLGYRRSRRGRLINIVVGFEGMFIAEDIVVLIFVVDEYVRTILKEVVTYVMSRWR